MLGWIERGDPNLERQEQARQYEIPDKELHNQRHIAEQLDPGIATARQPKPWHRANHADDDAHGHCQ